MRGFEGGHEVRGFEISYRSMSRFGVADLMR